jgi:predicted RNA-binding protein with PUA-like domain
MGGEGWIRSPQSWERLRHVKRGDLFICYQSDERKIYGLARASSNGYESRPNSGRFNCVDFAPRGLRLAEPVNISKAEHRTVFGHVRAFTVPSRGTIHALAADELRAVLRVLAEANPAQKKMILAGGAGF